MGGNTQFVTIKNGFYRGENVEGTFPMVRPWKPGAKGGFVTVIRHKKQERIKCELYDCVVTDAKGTVMRMPEPVGVVPSGIPATFENDEVGDPYHGSAEAEYLALETEEEAIVRVRRNFEILGDMTTACVQGTVRGLIVAGPPGIGKSYEVEEIFNQKNIFQGLSGDSAKNKIIKGTATPIALYKLLWSHRHKDNCLAFDDCDNILFDPVSLNLLKAALDSGQRRWLSWNAESRVLREEDIPNTFEFKGSVIFLTNLDFDKVRSKALEPHLKALKSRCLYLDLEISSHKDLLIRIRQIMKDGMLEAYDFSKRDEEEIYKFIERNVTHLQEVSLRTVKKIADLKKTAGPRWKELATHTVMKREARWAALLAEKKAAEE